MSVVKDYGMVKVVREIDDYDREKYGVTTHHSRKPTKWFNQQKDAELYADIALATGLREENTGSRGVPPSVALGDKHVVIAYILTLDGYDKTWFKAKGYTRDTLNTYLTRLRKDAEEEKEKIRELDEFEGEDL
ncbi:MAG: hypothetical protein ABEK59_09790 [Halobacteria archaeon]